MKIRGKKGAIIIRVSERPPPAAGARRKIFLQRRANSVAPRDYEIADDIRMKEKGEEKEEEKNKEERRRASVTRSSELAPKFIQSR